jgi:hypothetical protein
VRVSARAALVGVGVVLCAVLLWGGYRDGWRWTGFHGHATLWDWLEILMLPVAIAVAPLWARHGRRLDRTTTTVLLAGAAGFAILVVLGYTLDLGWTGFPGNRLWDWLELLVLPLVVATLPVWIELGPPSPRVLALAMTILTSFVALVLAGYLLHWAWTGFEGNTLFDWLHLFVAPLLLPLVVIPAAGGWMTTRIGAERPAQETPSRV